jgi:hypothetical protein
MHERGRHRRGNMLECSSTQLRFLQSKLLNPADGLNVQKTKFPNSSIELLRQSHGLIVVPSLKPCLHSMVTESGPRSPGHPATHSMAFATFPSIQAGGEAVYVGHCIGHACFLTLEPDFRMSSCASHLLLTLDACSYWPCERE